MRKSFLSTSSWKWIDLRQTKTKMIPGPSYTYRRIHTTSKCVILWTDICLSVCLSATYLITVVPSILKQNRKFIFEEISACTLAEWLSKPNYEIKKPKIKVAGNEKAKIVLRIAYFRKKWIDLHQTNNKIIRSITDTHTDNHSTHRRIPYTSGNA